MSRITIAVCIIIGAVSLASPAPAGADVPSPSIAVPFNAPRCPGATVTDPASAGMPVPNLLSVFGQRLTDYNAGRPVVLYDAYGSSNSSAYPPLCVTRHRAGVGAVSDWVFCTDFNADVCGETGAGGELMENSVAINPLDRLTRHGGLDETQVRLVSALLSNGPVPYSGTSPYSYGTTTARADGTTSERYSLQALVWCITNPSFRATSAGAAQTCDDNLDATEQDRLLALAPRPMLSVSAPSDALDDGTVARFSLTTNVFGTAITLSGIDPSRLSVCAGAAVLNGSALTVTGANPEVTETVELCSTMSGASIPLTATVTTPGLVEPVWVQSQNLVVNCQIFAPISTVTPTAVSANATALRTVSSPTTAGTPTSGAPATTTPSGLGLTSTDRSASGLPQELAYTGPNTTPALLWTMAAGVGLIALGGIVVSARRRLS